MARGRRKSIASELLSRMQPPPYKLYVSTIPNKDAITLEEFKKTRWSTYYVIDISNLVSNGKTNPDHLFELFGKFNGKTAVEVRLLLLKHIESNMDFYERRSVVCLKARGMRFDTWIESIGSETTFCDELALMGLCALYNRHCLIFTRNKFWSLLDTTSPIGFMKLLQMCSVKLIYFGDLKFGVLNWKPQLPKPLKSTSTKVPQFSIVEEYTLDDSPPEMTPIDLTKSSGAPQTASLSTVNAITPPSTNEETLDTFTQKELCELPVGTLPLPDTPADNATDNSSSVVDVLALPQDLTHSACDINQLPVETVKQEVLFTCPEDGLVLSQYPWTKIAAIKLDRLSSLTIDLWCNKISDYYQYVPVELPVKREIVTLPDSEVNTSVNTTQPSLTGEENNYDADTDVDIDNLLHHAKTLVQQVKVELNTGCVKPDTPKSVTQTSKKRKHASHVETTAAVTIPKKKRKPSSRVETASALDALHHETLARLKPVGEAPPKRDRTIKCRLCTKTFSTTRDLNNHHREEHGIVDCPQCEKKFTNQSSLDKHLYSHRELKYVCDLCGKRFPFESRLVQHSIVHINKRHQCPVKRCTKEFKGIGDLNQHIDTHKKGNWHRCEYCPYKNKDKRNTDSNMRTHKKEDDSTYECDKCHKIMHFSTQ